MTRYAIEYAKHVVVEVEADNEDEAKKLAYVEADGYLDGAWEDAEPKFVAVLQP